MSRIKLMIRRFFQTNYGYCTLIRWGELTSTHYSWSLRDALDWVDQYPEDIEFGIFRGKTQVF